MNPTTREVLRTMLVARATQSLEEYTARANKKMDEGWKPRGPEDTPEDVVLAVLLVQPDATGIAVAVWAIPPNACGLTRWTEQGPSFWAQVIQTAITESDGHGYFIISETWVAHIDPSDTETAERWKEQREKGTRISEMTGVPVHERAMLRLQLGNINLMLRADKGEDGRWKEVVVEQDGTANSDVAYYSRFDPLYNPPPGTLEN